MKKIKNFFSDKGRVGVAIVCLLMLSVAIASAITNDSYAVAASCWKCGGTYLSSVGTPLEACVESNGWQMVSATYCNSSGGGGSAKQVEVALDVDHEGVSILHDSILVTVGGTYGTLPNPTADDAFFEGWYTTRKGYSGGVEITSTTKVTNEEPHTLYARWDNECSVVFWRNNGVFSSSMVGGYNGADIGKPFNSDSRWEEESAPPENEGFIFTGWYTEEEGGVQISGSSIVPKTQEIHLYAHWIPVDANGSWEVSFDALGGTISGTTTKNVKFGDSYGTFPSVSKKGYQFDGWYSKNGTSTGDWGVQVTSDTKTADVTVEKLYAKWSKISYEVTLMVNDITWGYKVFDTIKVVYSEKYSSLPTPYIEGYNFLGWYTSKDGVGTKISSITTVTNTEPHTLYAHLEPKSYTVTIKIPDSYSCYLPYNTFTVRYGETYSNLPMYIGCFDGKFLKWKTVDGDIINSESRVTKNIDHILHADISSDTNIKSVSLYRCEDVLTCGSDKDMFSEVLLANSSYFGYLPSPTREGYTFDGWYTSKIGGEKIGISDKVNSVDGSDYYKKLYAHWTKKNGGSEDDEITYDVSLDANGGSVSPSTLNVTVGSNYGTLPTPTRSGYKFEGWYTSNVGGTQVTSTIKVIETSSHTLYAHWTKIDSGDDADNDKVTYDVTLNANGGSVSPTTLNVTVGDNYGTLPTPTRTGYTFKGWYMSKDGGTQISSTTKVTLNYTHTLYARWEIKKYTVTLNANGGTITGATTKTVEYNGTYGDFSSVYRSGYEFAGWYTAPSGGVKVVSTDKINTNSNHTLYARWSAACWKCLDGSGYVLSEGKPVNGFVYTNGTSFSTTNGACVPGFSSTNVSLDLCKGSFGGGSNVGDDNDSNIKGTYLIKYNSNGGNGTMATSKHVFDVSKNLTSNVFSRTGYMFKGWNSKPDGSGKSYSNSQSVINLVPTDGMIYELYAQWEPIKYTIQYNGNGNNGGFTADSNHTYDVSGNLTINGFIKTDYRFIGWKDSNGVGYQDGMSVKNLAKTNNDTIVLYAQWKKINSSGSNESENDDETENKPKQRSYSVKYNGNGGIGTMIDVVHEIGVANTLDAVLFNKRGYLASGWNTKPDGSGESYTNNQTVSNLGSTDGEVVELYAQWTPITYTIKYDGNGSTSGVMEDSIYTYGLSKALAANNFKRSENVNPVNTSVFEFEKRDTISPVINTLGVDRILEFSNNLKPMASEEINYEFVGWNTKADGSGISYSDGQMIKDLSTTNNDEITLYAQWTTNDSSGDSGEEESPEVVYTLRYNGNGGLGEMDAIEISYGSSLSLASNMFVRQGYVFSGWNVKADGSGKNYSDGQTVSNLSSVNNAVVTLYAQWNPVTYTIKYDGNGSDSGKVEDSIHTYDTSKKLNVNNYEKTDYIFNGWNTEADGTGVGYNNEQLIKNLTATDGEVIILFAQWKYENDSSNDEDVITYSIKYDSNGGKGSISNSIHVYGMASNLKENKFTRDGYIFNGWNTEADGSGISYTSGQTVSNLSSINGDIITLYAQWTIDDSIPDKNVATGSSPLILVSLICICAIAMVIYCYRKIKFINIV